MTKRLFLLGCLAFLMIQSSIAQSQWTTKWDNGFKVESPDKDFSLKFGGRTMFDVAWFHQDSNIENEFGELTSGVEFRRVRFFTSGTIYKNVKFKFNVELSGGETSMKDVYIELTKIPGIGNIRVGHFKEPFRLEVLTSSKYITFMERSAVTSVSQERNSGLMIYNEHLDKRLGWQLAVFRNADGNGNDENAGGKYVLSARVSGLLLNDKANNRLVHLGIGYSNRDAVNDELRVRIRPSAHLAPRYISTGTIKNVGDIHMINTEAALVMGPFSLQGEYLTSMADVMDVGSFNYSAWYAQASYFITGEHRPFKDSYSGFSRVKPKKNLGAEGGTGAWEVAVRYGSVDLNDNGINGGVLNDLVIALNWHLNPATRVMTNYVLADVEDLGKTSVFQMRFQVDF